MCLKSKLVFLIVLIIFTSSCTERFFLKVDEDVSILVVDGKITNETGACEVRLFRTVSFSEDYQFSPERNATIILHNSNGDYEILIESEPGIYHRSSKDVKGEIGLSYWVEIKTESGEAYESIPETMQSPYEISSMYGKEVEVIMDDNSKAKAIRICFDAVNKENSSSFLRWEYRETYEWRSPFDISQKVSQNPAQICYPINDFKLINVFDASEQATKEVFQLTTTTIFQNEVKLLYNYLIDLRLYTVSQENFTFWEKMKSIHQANGSLYDIVQANILGNVTACDDECKVLGYFEVSSKEKGQQFFYENNFSLELADFPEECEEFDIYLDRTTPDPMKYHILKTKPMGTQTVYTVRRLECYECNIKYPVSKPSFWP